MRINYVITYDAEFDQELFDKLATTAQTHIDPYTNGNFLDIYAQQETDEPTHFIYLTPCIRLN